MEIPAVFLSDNLKPEEIESERRWSETFARSGSILSRLADEALAEQNTGETQDLDPDRLWSPGPPAILFPQ